MRLRKNQGIIMFWWEWTPVTVLSLKVISHACYESTVEKDRSMQATGHLREAEKKVESRKELNLVH